MEIKTYRDLIAWQKTMDLAERIYHATATLPESERFGLQSQMRRAAVSIPLNIAEGHGRQSLTDYIRFLKTARGSLMELQTQVALAERLGFLVPTQTMIDLLDESDRILQGLIRSLVAKQKETV